MDPQQLEGGGYQQHFDAQQQPGFDGYQPGGKPADQQPSFDRPGQQGGEEQQGYGGQEQQGGQDYGQQQGY